MWLPVLASGSQKMRAVEVRWDKRCGLIRPLGQMLDRERVDCQLVRAGQQKVVYRGRSLRQANRFLPCLIPFVDFKS